MELVEELSRPRLPGVLLGRVIARGSFGRFVARLIRSPMRARWATTRVTRLHARLLRISGGRLRRSWLFAAGQPVMALTTTGRRTGDQHTTTVTAFCCREKLAIVGMNLGLERQPGWAYNLEANPKAVITIKGESIPVLARRTAGGDWAELWKQWLHVQPSADGFAAFAKRKVPIFVLEPRQSRLGSPGDNDGWGE